MIKFLKENKKEIIVGLIIVFVSTIVLKIFTPIFSIIWNYLKSFNICCFISFALFIICVLLLLKKIKIYFWKKQYINFKGSKLYDHLYPLESHLKNYDGKSDFDKGTGDNKFILHKLSDEDRKVLKTKGLIRMSNEKAELTEKGKLFMEKFKKDTKDDIS